MYIIVSDVQKAIFFSRTKEFRRVSISCMSVHGTFFLLAKSDTLKKNTERCVRCCEAGVHAGDRSPELCERSIVFRGRDDLLTVTTFL